MIGGRNGSGKTSFFEVICLGLFGKQIISRSGESGAVINLGFKEAGEIKIRFYRDKNIYMIKRNFKLKAKGGIQSCAELYKDKDKIYSE